MNKKSHENIYLFVGLLCLKSFAQDPRLFENTWYLTQFSNSGTVLYPPLTVEIPYVPAQFTEPTGFYTGACDAVGYGEIIYDGQVGFTFDNLAFLAGGCSAAPDTYFATMYSGFWVYPETVGYTYTIVENNPGRTLTVTNGLGDTAIYGDTFLKTTENTAAAVSIFPNPVSDILQINLVDAFSKITLCDATGKIVQSYNPVGKHFQIDLQSFGSGLYILLFEDENKIRTAKKIVKL